MRNRFYILFLTVVSVFVISGCSSNKIVKTYDGDVLPNEAISILTAPENITLLSVNDQPVQQYLLSNLEVNYGLKEGDNVVVFKYESIWSKAKRDEDTGKRVEVVESEPLVAIIPAKAGAHYTFNYLPVSNVREAEALASNFVAQIVDQDKNMVVESISLSDYESKVASQKEEGELLAMQEKMSASAVDSNVGVTSVLERLKAIWPSASADEKKAFLVWVFQK